MRFLTNGEDLGLELGCSWLELELTLDLELEFFRAVIWLMEKEVLSWFQAYTPGGGLSLKIRSELWKMRC